MEVFRIYCFLVPYIFFLASTLVCSLFFHYAYYDDIFFYSVYKNVIDDSCAKQILLYSSDT